MPSRGSTHHSLVRSVPDPDAVLDALAALNLDGFTRVWTVASDDHRDGPRATRIREIERQRPLAGGATLRCILLTHQDGNDLILVADRTVLPRCCLTALAAAEHLSAHRSSEAHRRAPAKPSAGSENLVTVAGKLCAALLRRDTVTVVLDEDDTVSAGFLTTATGTSGPASPLPADPSVGVVVTTASPTEYLPMLAPRYPVVVVAYQADDGSVSVRTQVDKSRVPAAVGAVMDERLPRSLAGGVDPFALEPAEIAAVLRAGRGPDLAGDTATSVPEAFALIAAVAGQRPAVTGEDTSMTYAELDKASRVMAKALVAYGITTGERIGVCMERTPAAIVTLLAVLRAGGCYVPLDPTHPPARRAYVAGDAGLRLVITDIDPNNLPADLTILAPDALLDTTADGPLPVVRPDEPAYVIYTSGTTGNPKGTVIPHRNVLALLAATRSGMNLATSDVWTAFHSLTFDFSVWEIWGCLLTGGRLVVVPYWVARTPVAFARLLRDERVTVLSQTPSAFVNLIPAVVADQRPLALRLVVLGGEALRHPSLIPWVRRISLSACRLVNMYGITETTVHVTWHDITATDIATNARTVGRALPGWEISVRAPDGRVLPFGVAGEICVGGAGLATGYLNRPELTAERFPTDPDTGMRYYRSGDLGRLHPDGTLDHLGRIDDQVKIRGYRVELGEIRATLLDDPAVRDAVVAFRDTDDGGAIHAYIVATKDVAPTDLRRRLRARLPDYMIPASLRFVDALPLTPNGKADLAALSAEDDLEPGPTMVAAPGPTASAESAVNEVWAGIFGASSLEHDFFDLGGTSLQALKIASALTGMGLGPVDPRDVYLNPTVAELAGFLTEG
jgi:amino acid adenylation domain-containing protein